jgi:hypothetical protein
MAAKERFNQLKDDSMQKKTLTKKAFEQLLRKAAQPLPEQKSDREGKGTSESHPSGDYTGTDKRPDTPEGGEG